MYFCTVIIIYYIVIFIFIILCNVRCVGHGFIKDIKYIELVT